MWKVRGWDNCDISEDAGRDERQKWAEEKTAP